MSLLGSYRDLQCAPQQKAWTVCVDFFNPQIILVPSKKKLFDIGFGRVLFVFPLKYLYSILKDLRI